MGGDGSDRGNAGKDRIEGYMRGCMENLVQYELYRIYELGPVEGD